MKHRSLASFLAASCCAVVGVGAECGFCPGGITVDRDTSVPNAGVETCGSLEDYADDEDYLCTIAKQSEDLCCPGADEDKDPDDEDPETPPSDDDGACVVCASGLTVSGDTTIPYEEANGISCEQMLRFAGRTDADDGACEEMQRAEAVCCPAGGAEDATTAAPDATAEEPDEEGACAVCAGGLTVGEGTRIPFEEANGARCGEMVEFAAEQDADSRACEEMKRAEEICCPVEGAGATTTVAPDKTEVDEDACAICSGGLTVDGDTEIPFREANGATCDEMVGYAAEEEADSRACEEMQRAEEICCPAATTAAPDAEGICAVCADGLTVDEDTEIPFEEANGARCGQMIEFAAEQEAGSRACEEMQRAEAICCPAEGVTTVASTVAPDAEGVCAVCAGGLTVDEDTEIPFEEANGASCEDMVEYAAEEDADSRACAEMKRAEEICCPASEDATTTVAATTAATTDGDAVASTVPGQVADPCPVCPDGMTAPADTVIGQSSAGTERTCGGLAADALTFPADGGVCEQMLGAERLCCPEGATTATTTAATDTGGYLVDLVDLATTKPTMEATPTVPAAWATLSPATPSPTTPSPVAGYDAGGMYGDFPTPAPTSTKSPFAAGPEELPKAEPAFTEPQPPTSSSRMAKPGFFGLVFAACVAIGFL